MSDYYLDVVNAAISLLQNLGYKILQPKPICQNKEIVVKALEQSFEGIKRDLYKTNENKWYLTYSKSGLLNVNQVHQSIVNELIEEGTIEPTYPNTNICYRLKERIDACERNTNG